MHWKSYVTYGCKWNCVCVLHFSLKLMLFSTVILSHDCECHVNWRIESCTLFLGDIWCVRSVHIAVEHFSFMENGSSRAVPFIWVVMKLHLHVYHVSVWHFESKECYFQRFIIWCERRCCSKGVLVYFCVNRKIFNCQKRG